MFVCMCVYVFYELLFVFQYCVYCIHFYYVIGMCMYVWHDSCLFVFFAYYKIHQNKQTMQQQFLSSCVYPVLTRETGSDGPADAVNAADVTDLEKDIQRKGLVAEMLCV